jgi:hypothetical protein
MPTQTLSLTREKLKGAGYHNINTGIQTFEFNFTNWSGALVVQGTLALDPTDSDWFNLNLVDPLTNNAVEFDSDSTDYDSTVFANCTGNFVWLRTDITTDSGTVNYIRYNY